MSTHNNVYHDKIKTKFLNICFLELSEEFHRGSKTKWAIYLRAIEVWLYFSYFSMKPKLMLWYSLKAPQWSASNKNPNNMFLWKNKKYVALLMSTHNISFLWRNKKKKLILSNLELCSSTQLIVEVSLCYTLILVLLNPDIPCLCKQCRSRSAGF